MYAPWFLHVQSWPGLSADTSAAELFLIHMPESRAQAAFRSARHEGRWAHAVQQHLKYTSSEGCACSLGACGCQQQRCGELRSSL